MATVPSLTHPAPQFLREKERKKKKKKRNNHLFLRFWAHERLTHVSQPFEVLGLFVETEHQSSALDKLIVSIKDLNNCHMQIHGKKKKG